MALEGGKKLIGASREKKMGIGDVSRSIFLSLLLVMVISKLCLIHSFIYCCSSCSCHFDKYTFKKHAKLAFELNLKSILYTHILYPHIILYYSI